MLTRLYLILKFVEMCTYLCVRDTNIYATNSSQLNGLGLR